MSDDELLALGTSREGEVFSELECAVIAYAVALSETPVRIDEETIERLRADLDERQLVELTSQITYGNHLARFSRAFDLPKSGASGGQVCAIPDHALPTNDPT